jgi:hypothetical protein
MVKVKTVFQPDKTLEVSEREAENLRRQGLLVENKAKAASSDSNKEGK